MSNELVYWLALSQTGNWQTEKINKLIVKIIHEQKLRLSEMYNAGVNDLKNNLNLDDKEIFDIENIKKDIPRYSFLIEDLLAQGYEIITIDSPKYSKTLKENLKLKHSPPILYVKGNTQLLQEDSIAIVGSRDADETSLAFTDNVAKNASKNFKVVVSGFAKGVDKQALDSAIKYNGQSIIVLPQGIMTFNSGFNKYYKEIQAGDVLVLSAFFPKTPWSVQLAMARNPIIYGLAKEIFVAKSSDKGGTWSGVIDGLKRNRTIYVRLPEKDEISANKLLIEKGAKPVDMFGNIIEDFSTNQNNLAVIKPFQSKIDESSLEDKVIKLLSGTELSSSAIIQALKLDWKTNRMTSLLKSISNIKVSNSKPLRFSLNEKQDSLFKE
ncbi:MAG: processing protein [Bacteroidota bacterium]|nr:processing protein [Bacteroidota bacterium]